MPEKRPTEKIEVKILKEIYFKYDGMLATQLVDKILEGVAEIVNKGFPEPFISFMDIVIDLSSSREETDEEFEARLAVWDEEERIRLEKLNSKNLKRNQTVEEKERKLLAMLKEKYES